MASECEKVPRRSESAYMLPVKIITFKFIRYLLLLGKQVKDYNYRLQSINDSIYRAEVRDSYIATNRAVETPISVNQPQRFLTAKADD